MPAAFVSFRTRWGAAVCAQTQQTSNPTLWLTKWAPEPRDVYWRNLSIPFVKLTIRRLIMAVALFFLTFFFMIPIAFVQSLASIEGIERVAPFLSPILEIKLIKSFIQGFLPGIALKIFLILLPTILMTMSKIEGFISLSELERRSAAKYYLFILVNVFLGSIITGTAFEQLNSFIKQSASNIPVTVGVAIPLKATFFITYIMVDGWSGVAAEILRVKPLIMYHLKNTFLVKTDQDREQAMDPGSLEFSSSEPRIQFYFLLGLVYSVVTPILLPFIVIFFGFAYVVFRHQIINVYNQEYESGAAFWPDVHGRIITAMIISQLLLMGLMASKHAAQSTPLLLVLPILTTWFHLLCKGRFEPAFVKFPLQDAMVKDTLERATDPAFNLKAYLHKAYIHPVFKDDNIEQLVAIDVEESSPLVQTKRSPHRNASGQSKQSSEISEPQKWGYSSDRKKLLVFFFGTKQIAFCNHVDVEAFTEEKKKNLLVKRQGKGADFVRAVDEIIDSFEKLKEQKINDEFSSGDEATESNVGNVECSSVSSCIKSPKETQPTSSCQPEAICSLQGNDSHNSEEVPVTSIEDNAIQSNAIIHEQPNGKVSILDQLRKTPLATIGSLRKRSRDTLSQTSDVQKRTPSLRRSRSSTRIDSCNLHKSEMQVEAISCQNDLVPDMLLEKCSLNSEVIRKSPVIHDTDSEISTFVPNNTSEDVGSRTVAVDSGDHPLNESGTVELDCKAESRIVNLDKGIVLNGGLDIQGKMVVLKKKRKPNKKRFDQEKTVHTKLEKKTCLQPEPSKNFPILSDSCHSTSEKCSKTDGDKHLPLVKRARVRMGNLSEEKKLDDLIDTVEKSKKEALVNQKLDIPSNSGDNHVINETFLNTRRAFDDTSPSNDHMQAKEHDNMPWKGNKYPSRGSTMYVEAALPPSKRLYRALEAMSANAAEASNDYLGDSNSTHASSNGNTNFSKTGSCNILLDGDSKSPRELHAVLSPDTNEVPSNMSGEPSNFSPQILRTSTESSLEAKHGDISLRDSTSLQSMDSKGEIMEVKDSKDLPNKAVTTELHLVNTHPCFYETRDETINGEFGQSSLHPSASSVIEGRTKEMLQLGKELPYDVTRGKDANSQVVKLEAANGRSEPASKNVDCVLKAEDVTDTGSALVASHLSGDMKSLGSLSDKKCDANIQEVTVGVKYKLAMKGTRFSPDSTPMKVLIAAAQAKRFFSRSGSLSENISCKLIPDGLSRSSLIYKEKAVNKLSPPNSVVTHTSALDEETSGLQSSSRSPDTNLQLKNSIHLMDVDEVRFDSASIHKQRSLNKSMGHAEATAARRSFENFLSTLSRTKDSIGRATRLAIDCAKYGIAGEVVQMLLQNLEKESSLNRKLDLFFLVDSITQCSRGQKGVAGDVYPSLFQSVLPRLLSAAAPPGNAAWDNRRQCLKVLRLWLERKTLPDSIVRHHIRELDSVNEASFSSVSSRRPPRTERPLNDPIREMEGMLVDEYGSNASFQIPGFLGSRMLEDEEESGDDEKGFETVTPEHDAETSKNEAEIAASSMPEKHTHILEDVDGELEMEDVSPPREAKMNSTYDTQGVSSEHGSHYHLDKHASLPFAPPLPADNPPSPPPLPSSPPPVAPPGPPILSLVPPPQPTVSHNHTDAFDTHAYMRRNKMQYPLSGHRPSAPSNVLPSDRVDYAPGYVDHPKQMQLPVSSFNSSSSYGYPCGSHSSAHSANDTPPLSSALMPRKDYRLQPPPPTISNQFSHAHSEKQGRQTWGDCLPFDRRGMFATEAQEGHIYGDRCTRGLVQHEISERCRFSAAVHSGPMLHEKVETSPSLPPKYDPPAETSSISSHGWSIPPRTSSYPYTLAASRPPLENQVSRVAGAHDYWRPR